MMDWKHRALLGVIVLGAPMTTLAASLGQNQPMAGQSPIWVAAKADDIPLSRDALFDLEPNEAKKGEGIAPGKEVAPPASRDELFDLAQDKKASEAGPPATRGTSSSEAVSMPARIDKQAPSLRGFFQGEVARTYANPDHWSKFAGRLELGGGGRMDNGVQWKASARLDYNAVFDLNNFYPAAVRDDQRAEFHLRENYLDFTGGGWDWRVGRQHIVWGEMVGLFFADVVSAKDLREFVLQDFQLMRIPQWAARAEYFKDDFHAELVWIPFPSYDEVGKPGAEFFAYPASPGLPNVLGSSKPANSLSNTNYGLRLSQLRNGWDMTGFIYSSMDSSPTYHLVSQFPLGVYNYQGRHERIHQAGGTLAKDFGNFVLKGEAIYTKGRQYNVTDPADADGVVAQNTLDWVVGLDFNPGVDARLNTQFFQRIYFNHNPGIVPDHVENGFSLLANYKFRDNLEVEALLVRSLNRNDWMFRPKLSWGFERNWRLLLGLDVFGGPPDGLFGQFDSKDRFYTEVRYDF